MLDFYKIATTKKEDLRKKVENAVVSPKFIINTDTKDLMIRGGDFYAAWDDSTGMWTKDEGFVIRMIDNDIRNKVHEATASGKYNEVFAKYMTDADSGSIDKWHKYVMKQMRDNYHELDSEIIFSNTKTKREDYVSHKLNYPLEKQPTPAYDELMSTLYSETELDKLEWAIGAVISGDAKRIQKFLVLYGSGGTGKSTILEIIQDLFDGYCSSFVAKELGTFNNAFALEAFKSNPLVAIDGDADLSHIEDNSKLNSLVSHDRMMVNEKFTKLYEMRFNSFLFIATNRPVKITEAKSGLIRRLIDVHPTGDTVPYRRYHTLRKQIKFELSGIAWKCLEKYKKFGEEYYNDYVPTEMLVSTNMFYNFVEFNYDIFKEQKFVTKTQAWKLYREYCEYAKVPYPLTLPAMQNELKNYFKEFVPRGYIDGERHRQYYVGFLKEKFGDIYDGEKEGGDGNDGCDNSDTVSDGVQGEDHGSDWLIFNEAPDNGSVFDREFADSFAQTAIFVEGRDQPGRKWENCRTRLRDLNPRELHYVKPNDTKLIFIDFDIPGPDGQKNFELNKNAAMAFPPTYAELSKSGEGIHLYYIYNGGDVEDLSHYYDEHIEIKICTGGRAIRRMLTKCNDIPIATITSGLPLKGGKAVVDNNVLLNEKAVRTTIRRALNKEYDPGSTKCMIDFIYKILDDQYKSGKPYDVTNMRQAVLAFAANSTHNADYCLKKVNQMKFQSEENAESIKGYSDDDPIVFFDVEVFPNLFIICWKVAGEDKPVVKWINPKPAQVEKLFGMKLVGFNNRDYDNHIIYAASMGYSNYQLYKLSSLLVSHKKEDREAKRHAKFGAAFNLSYTDIYDFSSKKQSLKKWEIELGISHVELGLPWDKEVSQDLWDKVAEYCEWDVIATETLFNSPLIQEDWKARQILADICGGSVNDTTNSLTLKIVFGNEKKPTLVYTDLATGKQTEGR